MRVSDVNKIIKFMLLSPLNPLKGRLTHRQLSGNLEVNAPLRGLGVRNTTLNICHYFSSLTSVLFILLLLFLNCTGQEAKQTKVRQPAVAGAFYPADPVELKSQLASFFKNVEDNKINENIAGIIVPHAGYVFSGQTAATAYARLDPEKTYSRIFLIGTSHHVQLNGASVYNLGDFKTPLGVVKVDTELANRLIAENKLFKSAPEAHEKEHCLEVQLPFLQYRLKKPFAIVPIIIGTQSAPTCKKIAEILAPLFTTENLFVISTDFSHYPSYSDAVKFDNITGKAISTNSPELFVQALLENDKKDVSGLTTSCCGWSSVLTMLYMSTENPEIKVEHVKYTNSGDSPYGDKEKVVGYHSFILTREKNALKGFSLSIPDKKMLLLLARESIESSLKNKPLQQPGVNDLTTDVKTQCGAFVTLNKNGKLRGCIGRFTATEPLFKVVEEMAQASAFQDTRFNAVTLKEMDEIEIEISVLTPLKRIKSIEEFELGKQGIYIIKGNRSGTFLPQVAHDTGWSKEEFLGHCARDKAGIGWDGWKDAELYTYEALVFNEKELISAEK